MATVTGFTAQRMQAIEDSTVVSGSVDENHNLILTLRDGTEINAGYVKGNDATALLSVGDSDTVNLSLAGLGTPASPWLLSAEVTNLPTTSFAKGFLEASYRGGNARVKVGGVLSSEYFSWMTPYDPIKSRVVTMMKAGGTWLIVGQEEQTTALIDYNESKLMMYNQEFSSFAYQSTAKATRLPSGLVVLSGLLRLQSSVVLDETIASLPVGFRPGQDMIFGIEQQDNAKTIKIKSNGDITARVGYIAPGYIALDGISFYADGIPQWTTIGSSGSSLGANFEKDQVSWAAYGEPAYWLDPYGFIWFRGLVRVSSAVSVDNTPLVTMPTALRPTLEQHMRGAAQEGYGGYGAKPDVGLTWKINSPGTPTNWMSLGGICYAAPAAYTDNPWVTPRAFVNSWLNYNSALYPSAGYLLREDGLRMFKGLVKSGTIATPAFRMHEKEMLTDDGDLLLPTISNQKRGRIDIGGRYSINFELGAVSPFNGDNTWFGLDQVRWVP